MTRKRSKIMRRVMIEYKDTLSALAGNSDKLGPEWEHEMKLAAKTLEKYKKPRT